MVGVVHTAQTRAEVEEYLEELALLLDTAGAEVSGQIIQERERLNPAYYIGSGMVDYLADIVKDQNIDLVAFDDDLSPAQVRNLEQKVETKVIDRSGIILDIFIRRAKSREAKTQVELAQLKYFLPRLTNLWTHLSRQAGGVGIGLRGMGEKQIEVDRRLIRKRITNLSRELEKISKQRQIRRKGRDDLFKVALLGYTNVGKSSLMNALTSSDIFVENRLFATLDSTVRTLDHQGREKIVLIDTVGFIRKLPHHLVASFKSTLEESEEADLIIHVVDCSHPNFREQMQVIQGVIKELKIDDRPRIIVFNKIDLVEDKSTLSDLEQEFENCFLISAKRHMFIEKLRNEIVQRAKENYVKVQIKIPLANQKLLSSVYQWAEVMNKNYDNGYVFLDIQFPSHLKRKLKNIKDHGVVVLDSNKKFKKVNANINN